MLRLLLRRSAASDRVAVARQLSTPRLPRQHLGFLRHLGTGPRDGTERIKLPPGICKPEDEFTRIRYRTGLVSWQLQKVRRLTNLWMRELLDFPTVSAIVVSSSVVVGCGYVEATLLSSSPVNHDFCFTYAIENVAPSFIWATKPADLIASSMDLVPSEVLHDWSDLGSDARRHLHVYSCESARCIFASFTLLTQILRAISRSLRVGDLFAAKVQRGLEPPLSGVPERVIRLCGQNSATTIVSLQRYGPHILPIFDTRTSKTDWILRDHSPLPYFPMFMAVDSRVYGAPYAWDNLLRVPNRSLSEWLLRTDFGYQILCLEADGTRTDDSFLSRAHPNEITIEQASRAFRQIDQLTSERLEHFGCFNHKVLRVFLGDTLATAETGGGVRYTLRDRILLRHEVDVLIDSHAPIWQKLLRWWKHKAPSAPQDQSESAETDKDGSKTGNGADHVLCFETSDPEYFVTVRKTFGMMGVAVVDQAEAHGLKAVESPEGKRKHRSTEWVSEEMIDIPVLLYYPSTSETVNAAWSLLENKEALASNVCVIVDQFWAVEELAKLKRTLNLANDSLEVICTPQVYDDLFRQVRQWARMGFEGEEIQRGLDAKYADYLSRSLVLRKETHAA